MNIEGIGMTSRRTRERLITRLIEQGISNILVIQAMRDTPRHIFLDEALSHRAYEDVSLPIGHGQTISQPFIVARMTELLIRDGIPERVLEIGTGSGFQTAILGQIVPQVYSVERIKALQDRARERLELLGLKNVHLKHSDGGYGWPEEAPFDAIIATCAPENVPQSLIDQLQPEGGRLVIPVGGEEQSLYLLTRHGDDIKTERIIGVKFVPLLKGTTKEGK